MNHFRQCFFYYYPEVPVCINKPCHGKKEARNQSISDSKTKNGYAILVVDMLNDFIRETSSCEKGLIELFQL